MSEIDFSEASRIVAVPPKPWDAASSGRVILVEDDHAYVAEVEGQATPALTPFLKDC